MTDGLGLIIEIVVAFLLMLTVGYCMLLNRRLKLLKADENALRATIAELVTATENAERATGGLKLTARECDASLGERLVRAERVSADLDRKLQACKSVIEYLGKIAAAGRRANVPEPPAPAAPPQDAQSIAAAAQAFSQRLRSKVSGIAA